LVTISGNANDLPDEEEQPISKVFVSYSRKDMAFADRLETALKKRRFEPLIDRSEIFAFEDWWNRIEALISKSDTVIFILSPDSVASDICRREVDTALSLNKRLAPVVFRKVEDGAVPAALARLNFIFFEDEARFEEDVDTLAVALSTDISWVRKHTEISVLARRWETAGRPGPRGLLLRSPALEEAERWIASRPRGAPEPTPETQTFIAESRHAATRRRNTVSAILGAGLVVALALAGIATWQRAAAVEQRQIAEDQRHIAQTNEKRAFEERDKALLAQSRFLAAAAETSTRAGDPASAIALALEALPDDKGELRRPFAPEAEAALFNARRELRQTAIITGINGDVESASFSPDGKRLAASGDSTPRIWNLANSTSISLNGHTDRVTMASFSRDGGRVLTASEDQTARIWDTETGAQTVILVGSATGVHAAAFSPDGKLVATAGDKTRIFDATSGRELRNLGPAADLTKRVAFSADGRYLVTTPLLGNRASIFNLAGGQPLVLSGHEDQVESANFSPDGHRMVTASQDGTARIWDVVTGKQLTELRGHVKAVTSATFSPNGATILTASWDGTARLWDTATGKEVTVFAGHRGGVLSAAFDARGGKIVTASADRTVRIWDLIPQLPDRIFGDHQKQLFSASFSPDGTRVVTASEDGTARIWNIGTDEPAVILRGHHGAVRAASFSSDGERVVTASDDRAARVWDVATGKQLLEITGHGGWVWSAMFSPDDRSILTSSADKTARIWDSTSGRQLVALAGHDSEVWGAAYDRDGRRVVTADEKAVRIWDIGTGQPIARLDDINGSIGRAAFGPDGQLVVVATGRLAKIWNTATGKVVTLSGHQLPVAAAGFSPDGRRVMTAAADKSVRIWDVGETKPVAIVSDYAAPVQDAEFSQNGRFVVTASSDGTARIWPIFAKRQDITNDTRPSSPLCLTGEQRGAFYLDAEPPAWCIELEKWPYQTQDWKDWLTFKRAEQNPPLPGSPGWQTWRASH
jgi:WD40 repeat protein